MIPVTKPFLPPKEEYDFYQAQIWERNWLTNNGPLVNELELKLKEYLNLKHLLFTSNGTIAIQLAIKALDLRGEIITTPFSYVATTSSIVWENCVPIFADIDPERLTLDPTKIEARITQDTSAILATHVYGIPCHVEEIEAIAKKHNLKVIYDAAHAFGTSYKNKSLLDYGDVSTLSTHATKLYHTVEGGAVVTQNSDLLKRLANMRNFGHDGPEKFDGIGINGKNSEFHAAMGLTNFNHITEILSQRKKQWLSYQQKLKDFNGKLVSIPAHTKYNHAYFPIIFKDEGALLKAMSLLERNKIYIRRYFYPTLNSLNYITCKNETPIANDIANRVACLPLYHTLTVEEQDMIVRLILRSQNH